MILAESLKLIDTSAVYVEMCTSSEELQAKFNEYPKHNKQFNVKSDDGKIYWLPTTSELMSLLGFDSNDKEIFKHNLVTFTEDLIKINKSYGFIDSFEKACLLIWMDTFEKYYNLVSKSWENK